MVSSLAGWLVLHKHAELCFGLFFLTRLSHFLFLSLHLPVPLFLPLNEGVPLCFILHFLFPLIALAILILPTVGMTPVFISSPHLSSELLVSTLGWVAWYYHMDNSANTSVLAPKIVLSIFSTSHALSLDFFISYPPLSYPDGKFWRGCFNPSASLVIFRCIAIFIFLISHLPPAFHCHCIPCQCGPAD